MSDCNAAECRKQINKNNKKNEPQKQSIDESVQSLPGKSAIYVHVFDRIFYTFLSMFLFFLLSLR